MFFTPSTKLTRLPCATFQALRLPNSRAFGSFELLHLANGTRLTFNCTANMGQLFASRPMSTASMTQMQPTSSIGQETSSSRSESFFPSVPAARSLTRRETPGTPLLLLGSTTARRSQPLHHPRHRPQHQASSRGRGPLPNERPAKY